MKTNNFLDNLFIDAEEDSARNGNDNLITDEIFVPLKCSKCKTSLICSILPTFINISKIRIHVSLEQCPYFQLLRYAEPRKTNI